MDETMEAIRTQLRERGIAMDHRDAEQTLSLVQAWMQNAKRVRAAVEAFVEPATGPVTTFTHVPERTGH